jgi:hypothetical protein
MSAVFCDAGHRDCYWIHAGVAHARRLYDAVAELLRERCPDVVAHVSNDYQAGFHLELFVPGSALVTIVSDVDGNFTVTTAQRVHPALVDEYRHFTLDVERDVYVDYLSTIESELTDESEPDAIARFICAHFIER